MTRRRIIFLIALAAVPFLFLMGVGSYHLWQSGWFFYAWWPMALCFATAYFLAWRWQKQMHKQVADEPPPMHYTDRDREAWKLIEERIRATDKVKIEELTGLQLYTDTAQQMSQELATIFHPKASDPVGNLTIPEMLTVVELAAHDLGQMAATFLPGGHLITIDNMRQARRAVKIYQRATQTFWAASAVIDPVRTGLRYVASRAGLGKPLDLFKDNVFLWFHANYIRKLGHYLIELYSGRLKVGAGRYRELIAEKEAEQSRPVASNEVLVVNGDSPRSAEARAVTIAVLGQVKAGKSSLINAILGERRAVTDVIPCTSGISRYELKAPNNFSRLVLLDTVGYNQTGPEMDQFETTVEAARESDLIFLVSHARNPGRDADVKLLNDLRDWFTDRPELKMPSVVLVLTHIDLLTPAMEWTPPYDWRNGTKVKEKNIAEAVHTAKEQFGTGISTIVPVCSSGDPLFGIQEELIPEITGLLGQARAVRKP
ncbi:MAG: 50S ribosome-binding GTPase [Planctomycetes bacterium]|nr:50S ribosome-binding GTPase [Planctomycetota bacterium]